MTNKDLFKDIDKKRKSKKELAKLLKEYHKKWDCFGTKKKK